MDEKLRESLLFAVHGYAEMPTKRGIETVMQAAQGIHAAAFAAGQQSAWIPASKKPEEDGQYLVAEAWKDEITYNTFYFRGGQWSWNPARFIAYQPITPYKPQEAADAVLL